MADLPPCDNFNSTEPLPRQAGDVGSGPEGTHGHSCTPVDTSGGLHNPRIAIHDPPQAQSDPVSAIAPPHTRDGLAPRWCAPAAIVHVHQGIRTFGHCSGSKRTALLCCRSADLERPADCESPRTLECALRCDPTRPRGRAAFRTDSPTGHSGFRSLGDRRLVPRGGAGWPGGRSYDSSGRGPGGCSALRHPGSRGMAQFIVRHSE